jgi:LysR family transcriptional regulator, low CO2-responsive transcriptional regulator
VTVAEELLEPDAVHAFGVFADHLNFTTAAATLHLSQPSLHAKIRKLQAGLGIALYERDGRGLRLTAAGERLAAFARDTARQAGDLLADLSGGLAPVVLAAGRGTFRWVIGDGIRRLAGSGRPVRVLTADRDAALTAVTSGRVDLAVIAHDPPPPSLRSTQLAAYPQTLLLPREHALADRTHLDLTDLDGLDLVVPPPGRPHRRALDRALLDAGVSWNVAAEVDGWELLAHFAALGLGATIVNGCVHPPAGLTAVPLRDLPAVRYWTVWRPERDRSAADALTHLRRAPAGPGRSGAGRPGADQPETPEHPGHPTEVGPR